MLSESLQKSKSNKKVMTPKSEKVERKRKISGDLTEKDISDLLGVSPTTPKAKKAKTIAPNSSPVIKKSPKNVEEAKEAAITHTPKSKSSSKKKKVEDETAVEGVTNGGGGASPSLKKRKSGGGVQKAGKGVNEGMSEEEVVKIQGEQERIKEAAVRQTSESKTSSKKKKRKIEENGTNTAVEGVTNGGVSPSLKKRKKGKSGGGVQKAGKGVNEGMSEEEVVKIQVEQERIKAEDNKLHLLVRGFGDGVLEGDLKKLSAEILEATIKQKIRIWKKGQFKSYAYLRFENEQGAERTMEKLKVKKFKGCALEVDYVGQKSSTFEVNTKPFIFDPKRLYVSGFCKDSVSEEKLKALFPAASHISLPIKVKDNISVGYALVSFEDEGVCKKLFWKEGGFKLDGRKLTVYFAHKKEF